MSFWHSQAFDCVASATAVSAYEPLMGTYDHVLLSLTGKCMVNEYVPSRRREALIDNRTEADWSVRSEPSTSTRKKELATVQFHIHIVLQTPGYAQGEAGPHFTDGLVRSPFSAHRPRIPETPAILNATTVALASATTVLAVFFASILTVPLVNVWKKGTYRRRRCSARAQSKRASTPTRTPAETQLPSDRVSCPSRSVEAGHVCGKKMRPLVEDMSALGIGSSNMLRVISLQCIDSSRRTTICRRLARTKERNERENGAAERRGVHLL